MKPSKIVRTPRATTPPDTSSCKNTLCGKKTSVSVILEPSMVCNPQPSSGLSVANSNENAHATKRPPHVSSTPDTAPTNANRENCGVSHSCVTAMTSAATVVAATPIRFATPIPERKSMSTKPRAAVTIPLRELASTTTVSAAAAPSTSRALGRTTVIIPTTTK